jgi:lantibiotic modifying enzyme
MAWCHGAPGIGLTRLRAYTLTGDETYRAEAEAAVQATMQALNTTGPTEGYNFSLCHGVAGNSELLIEAYRRWGVAEYRAQAEQIGQAGLETYSHRRRPWPCGIRGAGETPQLMLGLAGIGYFYLRLYNATANPSILLLSSTTA